MAVTFLPIFRGHIKISGTGQRTRDPGPPIPAPGRRRGLATQSRHHYGNVRAGKL